MEKIAVRSPAHAGFEEAERCRRGELFEDIVMRDPEVVPARLKHKAGGLLVRSPESAGQLSAGGRGSVLIWIARPHEEAAVRRQVALVVNRNHGAVILTDLVRAGKVRVHRSGCHALAEEQTHNGVRDGRRPAALAGRAGRGSERGRAVILDMEV